MVKIKLNFKERMTAAFGLISGIQHASLMEWNYIDELLKVFGLDDETKETYGVKQDGALLSWKNEELGKQDMEYSITPGCYEFLMKKLKEVSEKATRDQRELAKKLGVAS